MAMDAKTVAVALRLEAGQFTAGLGMAAGRVRAFGAEVQAGAGKVSGSFKEMANSSDKHLKTVGTAGLIAGGLVVAGLGLAAGAAMNFDKQMSEVGAVASATGSQLGELRDAAIEAGAATVFSASQAAQAEAELAKAGVSTRDILSGGLTGALDLASAGSLDLATAAEIAANAMNQFKLKGSDVGHISDLLAAGANKSATDVAEMGMALKQGGAAAANMGISLDQTVGLLAVFAQNALKGSDGGTAMKTMLASLAGVSGTAKEAIAALGLNFFDATGKFLGLENAAEELRLKLKPLSDEQRSQALNTIFGTDAARGAIAMMDGGAAAVRQWTDEVNQSGYAAELAAQKNDNLAGDLEQLKGSMETALIQGGSMATDVLRGLASGATDVVNGLGAMPTVLQGTTLGFVGLVGLGASAIGIYGTLAPKITVFKEALEGLGGIGPSVAANLGTIGLAAGGITAGLGLVTAAMGKQAQIQADFNALVDRFTAAMKDAGGATNDFNSEIRKAFVDSKVGSILADSSANLDVFADAVRNSGTELDYLARFFQDATGMSGDFDTALQTMADSGNAMAQEMLRLRGNGEISADELRNLVLGFDGMNDAVDTGAEKLDVENKLLGGLTAGTGEAATGVAGLGDAQQTAAVQTKEQTDAINDQINAIMGLAGGALGLQSAQIAAREELVSYNAAMADGTLTANEREQAGVDLLESYLREAEAASSYAEDQAKAAGGSLSAAEAARIQRERLETLRDTLAPGNPLRAQLQGYIDQLYAVPTQVPTQVTVDTSQAEEALANLRNSFRITGQAAAGVGILAGDTKYVTGLDGKKYAQANGGIIDYAGYANGGIHELERYANGGMRRGIAGIAPANSNVLFAETPATGDEAYIPLGPSKRQRSVAIWAETGRRLGMDPGGGGTQVALQVAVDARGSTAADARAIEAAVDAGIRRGIPTIKRELERSDRSLR